MEKKVSWWRYVLAAIVFIASAMLFPVLWSVVQNVLDFFSPRYFKQGATWIQLTAYLIAPFVTVYLSNAVTKGGTLLQVGMAILFGAYFIFVAAWNYVAGINTVLTTVELGVSGLLYIVLAIATAMDLGKGGKNGQNT